MVGMDANAFVKAMLTSLLKGLWDAQAMGFVAMGSASIPGAERRRGWRIYGPRRPPWSEREIPYTRTMARGKPATERIEKFGPWIGVGPLLDLVEATAPFLFSPNREPATAEPTDAKRLQDLVVGPEGWWHVLRRARAWLPSTTRPTAADLDEYFTLCCAAHHATVGTYTPTDVDAKIRGVLWQEASAEHIRRRWAVVVAWRGWDERLVCTRGEPCGAYGLIGGHDGERLGVSSGALGAALGTPGAEDVAEAARTWIAEEVVREADALRAAIDAVAAGQGEPLALLRLAWIATHNVGDLNQGISFWPQDEPHLSAAEPFARLAHENAQACGGVFLAAKRLYHLIEAEGHRNYPLRQARCLRPLPDLLLPLGPCLEDWGEQVARHRKLDNKDHLEVIAALVEGGRKVPGQIGYYRALVGLREGLGGTFDRLCERLTSVDRKHLAEPDVRRRLMVSATSFHSSLSKQARAVVAQGDQLFR